VDFGQINITTEVSMIESIHASPQEGYSQTPSSIYYYLKTWSIVQLVSNTTYANMTMKHFQIVVDEAICWIMHYGHWGNLSTRFRSSQWQASTPIAHRHTQLPKQYTTQQNIMKTRNKTPWRLHSLDRHLRGLHHKTHMVGIPILGPILYIH
jgi:hypothetical protein